MGLITLGLCQIKVGVAAENGTMPSNMTKIGKTYKDTAKIQQDKADVTEHFEEGKASPEIRRKQKKMPYLVFSIMDADVQAMIDYVGGINVGTEQSPKWGYDGDEVVANKSIFVETEQGLDFEIPNGDIEAIINSDFSAKGISLIEFTVVPCAVTAGKALRGVPKQNPLTVNPTALSFTAAADTTGKTITAASTSNITSASVPSEIEWCTVTKSAKVATVKVSANTNGESRSCIVSIVADGKISKVVVTQAGV